MNQEERKEFVRNHRTCIYAYERRNGPPSMSVVYYVMDGDDILVVTMAARAKALALRRNSQVSLCILDEKWPLSYLLVFGRGRIEEGGATDMMMKITEIMSGVPTPESKRPELAEMARKEKRVVIRITPESSFETPPRHIYADTDISTITHSLGATLPWNG